MSEYLETTWAANPHTIAKHRILAAYLKAWMPILSRHIARSGAGEVLFIDGFAGPGRYTGGEDGSPVIAMNVALDHAHQFPVPISLLFIESETSRFKILEGIIRAQQARLSASSKIRILPPQNTKCETAITQLLDDRDAGRRLRGPILAFLDQFGYKDVRLSLIARIMKYPHCEVFSYLNWHLLNPYMTDKTKWPAITGAFGDESWKACLSLRGQEREAAFLRLYAKRLREEGNSTYVWSFAMCGEGNQLLYWLFFCTNSIRGLEEMKKAMWKVDDKGSFRFSDGTDPNQLTFSAMHDADEHWLAEHLHRQFLGRSLSVSDVRIYVLLETPCYVFKSSLAILERANRLRALPKPGCKRSRGDFADPDLRVEFVAGPAVQQPLL